MDHLRPLPALFELRKEDERKVAVPVRTTPIRELSWCQDSIVPLSQDSHCTAKLLVVHAASGHEA